MYSDISQLVSRVNQNINSMLLLTFAVQVCTIFRSFYQIFFLQPDNTWKILYRAAILFIYFTQFVVMCLFASSVSNAALDLKLPFCAFVLTHKTKRHVSNYLEKLAMISLVLKFLIAWWLTKVWSYPSSATFYRTECS